MMTKKTLFLLAIIPSLIGAVVFYFLGNNLVALVFLVVALMDVLLVLVLGDKLFPPKK